MARQRDRVRQQLEDLQLQPLQRPDDFGSEVIDHAVEHVGGILEAVDHGVQRFGRPTRRSRPSPD